MSHFYGEMWSDTGKNGTSKTGHQAMSAHIRSWDVGVHINCYVDDQGQDVIEISRTGGSTDPTRIVRIAELVYDCSAGAASGS